MSRDVSAHEDALRDAVVAALHVHDVHYISGPGETYAAEQGVLQIEDLIGALVSSNDARLRTALVGLLLRHPEYASATNGIRLRSDATAGSFIAVSIVAAAALQQMWIFSLDIYLPGWQPIDAEGIAATMGIMSPLHDYGRTTLVDLNRHALSHISPDYDYRGAWENVAEHVLEGLKIEMSTRGAA